MSVNSVNPNMQNKIKSDESTSKLSSVILDFCKETIRSIETGVYKNAKPNVKKQGLNNIQCKNLVKYFNSAYKLLFTLDTNSEYFVKKFNEMTSIKPHNYICLLNITFFITSTIAQGITRSELDDTTYEVFMESIEKQITKISENLDIEKLILHSCDNNKQLDPNIELFYVEE
jgi:hypothetical protein